MVCHEVIFQFDLDSGSPSERELVFSKVNKPARHSLMRKCVAADRPAVPRSGPEHNFALDSGLQGPGDAWAWLGEAGSRMRGPLLMGSQTERAECMFLECPKCVCLCVHMQCVCVGGTVCVMQMCGHVFLFVWGACA